MSSGTLWESIARAAAAPFTWLALAEYGKAMVTGWPHGPCMPGTVGGEPPPHIPPEFAGWLQGAWSVPVHMQPLMAASSTIAPADRFIRSPCRYDSSAFLATTASADRGRGRRMPVRLYVRSPVDILGRRPLGTFVKSGKPSPCRTSALSCLRSPWLASC